MTYIVNDNIESFEFWGGAEANAARLTSEQLDQFEEILDELRAGQLPLTDVEINDLFWFEFDTVLDLLGLKWNKSETELIPVYEDEEEEEFEEEENDMICGLA